MSISELDPKKDSAKIKVGDENLTASKSDNKLMKSPIYVP